MDRNGLERGSDIEHLHEQMLQSNKQLDQLEMEKASLETELRRMEATHSDKERHCQNLIKDLEYAKERETVLRIDRSVLFVVLIKKLPPKEFC